MEQNMGARLTSIMVNEHREQEGLSPVSVSAVLAHFHRMQPLVTKVKTFTHIVTEKLFCSQTFEQLFG